MQAINRDRFIVQPDRRFRGTARYIIVDTQRNQVVYNSRDLFAVQAECKCRNQCPASQAEPFSKN